MIHSTSFLFCFSFFFFVCGLFLLFCFLFRHRCSTGPRPLCSISTPVPRTDPALSFENFLPAFSSSVCALGARACAACVCVCVCVSGWCVCTWVNECVFSECVCVGMKASLCVCRLGLGVTLACLLHTSCGISSPVFKTLLHPPTSASSPLGLPPLSVLHGPLLPTLTLQRKHGFHTAKKEQGCRLSSL